MAEVDRFEAGQAPEAASLEVGQPVVAEVELFEADDVDEAVLLKLLDRVPAQVQLLQGLDGRHGAAGDRGVRNPVASQAHFPQLLAMAISSVQFPSRLGTTPIVSNRRLQVDYTVLNKSDVFIICSSNLPPACARWVRSIFSSHCSLSSKQCR